MPRAARAGALVAVVVAAVVAAATGAPVVDATASSAKPGTRAVGADATAGAVGAGYWHTSGNQILDANDAPVRIAGINWYGFETTAKVAHGLYAQDYHDIIDTIDALGYNTIRLPFSNAVVEAPIQSTHIGWANGTKATNLDLKGLDSMQVMDKIIEYSGQVGLKVILDNHRSDAGNSAQENGLWYTAAYPHQRWLDDWAAIARRYAGNPTVIGYDLRNEPHTPADTPYEQGATWGSGDPATDWRLAAEAAGNRLLGINPNALIFVEGIGQTPNDSGGMDATWWGGDLALAARYPVRLSVPNRLVYSPHDYGPRLYRQPWFNSGTTQASLEAVWDRFWGYLDRQGIAPVMVGEFGTTNNAEDIIGAATGSQGQWFFAMITYLGKHQTMGWTYWALNGNDDFGLLDAQFHATPVSAAKQRLLATLQFPLPGAVNPPAPPSASPGVPTPTASPGAPTPTASPRTPTPPVPSGSGGPTATPSPRPPTGCAVAYSRTNEWPGGFTATVTVTNTGTTALRNWTLTFTLPGDQRITSAWEAVVTANGARVTVTNTTYNGPLAAGGTVAFGFQGTWSTNSTPPADFALNGLTCTSAVAHI